MTQKIISLGIAENTGRIDDIFFRALENFAIDAVIAITQHGGDALFPKT